MKASHCMSYLGGCAWARVLVYQRRASGYVHQDTCTRIREQGYVNLYRAKGRRQRWLICDDDLTFFACFCVKGDCKAIYAFRSFFRWINRCNNTAGSASWSDDVTIGFKTWKSSVLILFSGEFSSGHLYDCCFILTWDDKKLLSTTLHI